MGDWDIYLTSEVGAWLEDLQVADAKTADLVDDAIYALSRSGPTLGRPLVGDKAGKWTRWYAEAIRHAERLYEIYLKERAEEERSGR